MGQPSILIVDDEQQIREVITKTLQEHGYRAWGVSSGLYALEEVEKEAVSLVISDVRMPGMSGLELLNRIKANSPPTRVIMMSAYGSVENAVEAIQAGASDYLMKPFSSKTLLETVRKNMGLEAKVKQSPNDSGKGAQRPAHPIITQDEKMLATLEILQKISPSKSSVLITGESGTGKELIAAKIHALSGRGHNRYIAMNCAALPETLAESELFGHERGAFTGAFQRKQGKFEMAHGGTLVLDEISELPLNLQAKLLRVLQENMVDRIGGSRPIPIDARIIAISNLDLKTAVQEGRFREDLFYRLNVIPIQVPPLRERCGDLPLLVEHFVEKVCHANHIPIKNIDGAAMALLEKQTWKGNVRELENSIERAVLISSGDDIHPDDFMFDQVGDQRRAVHALPVGTTVREMEKVLILDTLKAVSENRTHAAKLLGISIRTLRNKLKEYKLTLDPAVT